VSWWSKLLDVLGRKPPEAVRRNEWSTPPASGVSRGLTPDELAAILTQAEQGDLTRQAQLFEEIEEKDSYLASLIQTRKNSILGLDWNVRPADDSSEAQRIADEVRSFLYGLDLEDLMLDLLDAIAKGISVVTLGWKYRGGRYDLDQTYWVHQRDLIYEPRTEEFFIRGTGGERLPVQPGGAIVHRYKAKSGSPVRAGLLRGLSWLYLFKNYSMKDWVTFLELYGQPVRIGKYDPGASEDDRRALMRAVMNLGVEAAGVISKSTEIDFIEAQKYGSSDAYDRFIRLMEREMAVAVLGQALASFDGEGGSNALAVTLDRVRVDLKRADTKALARTLRRDLIIPFCHYNGFNAALAPFYEAEVEEPEDLKAASEVVKTLADAGLRIPTAWAYDKFAIPAPQEGEEVLGAPPQTDVGALAASRRQRGLWLASGDSLASAPGFVNGMLYVDALAETGARRAGEVLATDLDRILQAIRGASGYAEARQRLAELYQDMSPVELSELTQRLLLMGELAGQAAVREDL
jgi:phage gp29-like protein